METISFEEFLRRLPKAELHCHLVGAIPAETAWEIATRNGVELPASGPESLYDFGQFYEFIERYMQVAEAMRTREDFAQAAYAALRAGHLAGNVRYREMFFNPTDHYRGGVAYPDLVDGLLDGIRQAEQDFGVRCRLIPSINRMESPAVAVDMVRDVLRWRRDEVIGIGLDAAEPSGPPENFAEAYRLAEDAGLHRTAHVCEDYAGLDGGPPANALTALDLLHCDRLDHGYNLLADPAALARCRDAAVPFTVCEPGSNEARLPKRRESIRAMIDAGLPVSLHSDDPAMHGADPGDVYVGAVTALGLDVDGAIDLCLAAVDAAWLDDTERRELRSAFRQEIAGLRDRLA
ncbi:adenosine deaminase [Saccharopolyspora sp. NPDC050389]|uniref:adenosine deaminase n=1 Tax=Saccharopolyspora sp. NPDC050389 TaxID=3155516 RepID=UPI0033E45774